MARHGLKNQAKKSFDVSHGSFDSAEVLELMGLYILNKINEIVHIDSHGLYRDNRLMIVTGNRRVNNRFRKQLFKLFKSEVNINK